MLTHPGTIWAQPEVAGVILQPWRPTLMQGVSSWSRGANTGPMEANPGVIWDPAAMETHPQGGSPWSRRGTSWSQGLPQEQWRLTLEQWRHIEAHMESERHILESWRLILRSWRLTHELCRLILARWMLLLELWRLMGVVTASCHILYFLVSFR